MRFVPLASVEVPEVTLSRETEIPPAKVDVPCPAPTVIAAAKVDVAAPVTTSAPVVVAPPEMVRPPAWVPLPIVVDASESKPFENVRTVEVALPTKS